jgi:hypothetical protein
MPDIPLPLRRTAVVALALAGLLAAFVVRGPGADAQQQVTVKFDASWADEVVVGGQRGHVVTMQPSPVVGQDIGFHAAPDHFWDGNAQVCYRFDRWLANVDHRGDGDFPANGSLHTHYVVPAAQHEIWLAPTYAKVPDNELAWYPRCWPWPGQ